MPMERIEHDIKKLRSVLRVLRVKEHLSSDKLIVFMQIENNKGAQYILMSRNTLDRFRDGKNISKIEGLHDIWDFLHKNEKYNKYFNIKQISKKYTPVMNASAPERIKDALSTALTQFFCEEPNVVHTNNMDTIKKRLPGRYVMYRPDWRALSNHHPPSNAFTVSLIEISLEGEALCIKEIQNFPTSPYGEIDQINSGVFFRYGSFLIALMNGKEIMSFKCLVINDIQPFSMVANVSHFSGEMLVASGAALFPSQKIFCQRIEGDYNKFGIFPVEEIDNDIARKYVLTPIFEPYKIIS